MDVQIAAVAVAMDWVRFAVSKVVSSFSALMSWLQTSLLVWWPVTSWSWLSYVASPKHAGRQNTSYGRGGNKVKCVPTFKVIRSEAIHCSRVSPV